MKTYILKLIVLCFLYSCSQIKLQKMTITKNALPKNCNQLYEVISTNWYKHKNKNCHKETFNVFEFCNDNKECLENLRKEQVIMLLGTPDITKFDNTFGYVINKDCKNKSLLVYYFLQFHYFSENKNKVEVLVVDNTH